MSKEDELLDRIEELDGRLKAVERNLKLLMGQGTPTITQQVELTHPKAGVIHHILDRLHALEKAEE